MNNFSSFSFIFVGDTHGYLNDFKKQKEIIEKVQPEFVLVELLQDVILDTPEKLHSFSKEKKFKDLKPLIDYSSEKNIKLIGLDLKDFGLHKELQQAIFKGIITTDLQQQQLDKILKKRQYHHYQLILKYASLTSKPLVILLGTWHLQKKSILMNRIPNYLVIYPVNEKGIILLEPPLIPQRITYVEKSKYDYLS